MMATGGSLHPLTAPTEEQTLSRLSEQPPDSVKPTKGTRQALFTHSMRSGGLSSPRAALTLTSDTESGSSDSSFRLKLFLLET